MITDCFACTAAGQWNTKGDYVQAERTHRLCTNPSTCPCHHRTGLVLNLERMAKAKTSVGDRGTP